MGESVLSHDSRKQKGGQGSGCSPLGESCIQAEALGELGRLMRGTPQLSTTGPGWGHKVNEMQVVLLVREKTSLP